MRVSPAQPAASPAHPSAVPDEVPVEALGDLYRDGITACRAAFDATWVDQVGEDVTAAFDEARSRPDGAVGRGPQRWYVEIHPEQLRGFVELVTQPWVVSVCQAVLGPEYEIVELGFDIPFPGAALQPWHRDFPMPEETRRQRRLTSLAFNLTTVDTVEEMGPFEIAPGTQWDHGADFDHAMFPPRERYPRYQQRAVRKYPQRGDISARSALTIHRGTPNVSRLARPVLVLGVDAPGAGNAAHHDMAVTRSYWESLPPFVREHLPCPVVDRLEPIRQKHTIEGLVMGAAE
ncbi:phytanoyl-CoA dioxygenase family protein [Micromonospora sp. LAH09]|uniref:phytanoyl-CoA dioxygenase family protein n=1 Tax=Micromonospora cabrerizensis TaxID=2911213 RepID=UPI001EE7909F|nr:phytanoyl-CoA dioxygenase family protein [Micromonospora cabrerizensis]MCG5470031.1 phytanoyl-CoA dioxygenase family protein [Micromonospora cabrerizensis]